MTLAERIETLVTTIYPDATFLLSSDFERDYLSYFATSNTLIVLNNQLEDDDTIVDNASFLTKERIQISVYIKDEFDTTDKAANVLVEQAKAISRKIYFHIWLWEDVSGNGLTHRPAIKVFNSIRSGCFSLAMWSYSHVVRCSDTSVELLIPEFENGFCIPNVGTYNFQQGEYTSLYAEPIAGFRFKNWLLNNAPNLNPLVTLQMLRDTIAVPIFEMIEGIFSLTITKTGYCDVTPQVGSHNYNDGDIVPITVTLGDNEQYIESINGDLTPSNPYNVTMDANKTVPVIVKPYIQELQVFDRAPVLRGDKYYFGDYAKDNDVLIKNVNVGNFANTTYIDSGIKQIGQTPVNVSGNFMFTSGVFNGKYVFYSYDGNASTKGILFNGVSGDFLRLAISNGSTSQSIATIRPIINTNYNYSINWNGLIGGLITITINENIFTSTATHEFIGNSTQNIKLFAGQGICNRFNFNNYCSYVINHGQGTEITDISGNNNHGTINGAVLANFWGSTSNEAIPYDTVLGATLYRNNTDNTIMPVCMNTNRVRAGYTNLGYFPPSSGILKGLPNTYNILGIDYTADQIAAFTPTELLQITQTANTVSLLKLRSK